MFPIDVQLVGSWQNDYISIFYLYQISFVVVEWEKKLFSYKIVHQRKRLFSMLIVELFEKLNSSKRISRQRGTLKIADDVKLLWYFEYANKLHFIQFCLRIGKRNVRKYFENRYGASLKNNRIYSMFEIYGGHTAYTMCQRIFWKRVDL